MLDISKLSGQFDVRRLGDADAAAILSLCKENTQFYFYCEAEPTLSQVLSDLHITPPDTPLSSKYYVGFYQRDVLVAVMDLIDGYPDEDVAFIDAILEKDQSIIISSYSEAVKNLEVTLAANESMDNNGKVITLNQGCCCCDKAAAKKAAPAKKKAAKK